MKNAMIQRGNKKDRKKIKNSLTARNPFANLSAMKRNTTEREDGMNKAHKIAAKDHDMGAADVTIYRETREDAERSADLMRQCGYRTVTVD